MSDLLILLLIIFVVIIILGLYISDFTPLNLSEKKNILSMKELREEFNPLVSNSVEQTEGASNLYDWNVPAKRYREIEPTCEEDLPPRCVVTPPPCNHTCNNNCPNECPKRCPPTPKPTCCPRPRVRETAKQVCYDCDITLNKDIDKYVLKSSVPACPDMSKFMTKNMANSAPDMTKYILKSEIKPCDKVDISKYILKSEIPACPKCPICPECPICPVCPPPEKCKEISEYNITDHPDYAKICREEDNSLDNNMIEEETPYCKYIDKIYEEAKKIPKTVGLYVGDDLYAKFGNGSNKSPNFNGYYAGDSVYKKIN